MTESLPNQFKLVLPITKTYTQVVDGIVKRYLKGLASGIEEDRDGEQMNPTAILAFAEAIKGGYIDEDGDWRQIELRNGHRTEATDLVGYVIDAEVDDAYNLWITAELEDEGIAAADSLWKLLTEPRKHGRPVKLGFSIMGYVEKAHQVWDDARKRWKRVFDLISLREISTVSQPSYKPSLGTVSATLAKSVDWSKVEKETMTDMDELTNGQGKAIKIQGHQAGQDETAEKEVVVRSDETPEVSAETEATETVAEQADATEETSTEGEAAKSVADDATETAEEEVAKDAETDAAADEEVAKEAAADTDEAVEKTDESEPTEEEVAKDAESAAADLRTATFSAVAEIARQMGEMAGQISLTLANYGWTADAMGVQRSTEEAGESEVEKEADSTEETVEKGAENDGETVAKSDDEAPTAGESFTAESVEKYVTALVSKQIDEAIAKATEPLRAEIVEKDARIEELENEPIDKGLAALKEKTREDETPVSRYQSLIAKGVSPIRASLLSGRSEEDED